MKTVFGIFVNPRKEQVAAPLDQLDAWISQTKPDAEFLLCTFDSVYTKKRYKNIAITSEKDLLQKAHIIVTFGGDGTILRSVRSIGRRQIPILGVNLGGLGFLADTPPELFLDNIKACAEGHYLVEERALLQCTINQNEQTFYAFNDVVIDKAGFSRVIEIVTYVDDYLLNSYIADALIISTPSGSTGYSLSAGGPIVIPQTNVIIINPICPHSLTNRPVVVPGEAVIRLRVATEYKEINIFGDGQLEIAVPSGTEIEIKNAPFGVQLIKMKEREFFETMRNKLHWGDDFRDKKRWSYEEFDKDKQKKER